MKNLVFIVLAVVVAIVAYDFINKSQETTQVETSVAEQVMTEPTDMNEQKSETAQTTQDSADSMVTPGDMPDAARTEMFQIIVEYRTCMFQNKAEYYQKDLSAQAVADETLAFCNTKLDDLAAILKANNVNSALVTGMVAKQRSKAASRLMSLIVQSMASQAAALPAVPTMP